jgi:hypothetical protein
MTVGQLLASISSRELTEWQVYYGLEPFGEERADLRAGIVASVVANSNRDPKRQAKPFEPRQFMPRFEEEPEEPDPDALWAKVSAVMFAAGGTAAGDAAAPPA